MAEIGFRAEGETVEALLSMRPGVLVLTGLNATMKSVFARTFLVYAGCGRECEGFKPTLLDVPSAKVEFLPDHESVVKSAERRLIADSRVALRSLLTALSTIEDIVSVVERLKRDERIGYDAENLLTLFDKLLDSVGLRFLEDLSSLKSRAPLSVMVKLYKEIEAIEKKMLSELGETFPATENLDIAVRPLDVSIKDARRLLVKVIDRRFMRTIEREYVSTSVIAPLLFEYVTAFLSLPETKVLVVEEPEESMTPLQQVLFARYLEEALARSAELTDRDAYVVVTTHSPYISNSFEKATVKYFHYDTAKKKIVVEDKPVKAFWMAELSMLSLESTRR